MSNLNFFSFPNIFTTIEDSKKPILLSNINIDSGVLFFYFLFQQNNKDLLLVVKDNTQVDTIYNLFKILNKDLLVLKFKDLDSEPYSKTLSSRDLEANNINTLIKSLTLKEKKIVITSSLGYIQKTLPINELQNNLESLHIDLKLKDVLPRDFFINKLIQLGYEKKPLVLKVGDFALRGDIIDIFPNYENPIRLSFFDDELESIKFFDKETQLTLNNVETFTIYRVKNIILNQNLINRFLVNYKEVLGTPKHHDYIYHQIKDSFYPSGIESFLPLFFDSTNYIADYLNNPQTIFFNVSKIDINYHYKTYEDAYIARISSNEIFKQEGFIPLKKESLLLQESDLTNLLENQINIFTTNFKEEHPNYTSYVFSPSNVKNYFMLNPNNSTKLELLLAFLKEHTKQKAIIIQCFSEESLIKITKNLRENFFKTQTINNIFTQDLFKKNIYLIQTDIFTESFILDDFILISEDIFTDNKKVIQRSIKKTFKNALKNINNLFEQDIIAHITYGIGIYLGLKSLKVNDKNHDFLEIQYKNNAKLYVPVENIDLITKYSGSDDVQLDTLGGTGWTQKKEKALAKIKDIAYDLVKIAANRKLTKSSNITTLSEEYNDFIKNFPYVETEDQLQAIEDVIADLESGKVMDRLVCGDVGFGKTEIALRAAFFVANSGFQVALIAPTTLLCNQHYHNFTKRFKNTAIKVAELSRFVSTKDKTLIKKELEEGKIDIIIGTHSLLSSSIKFKNLNLIVIDEEQNFGVIHKEKLKTLKSNCHVLTLTATPIPRTMQMALNGIKDLSLISTPPIEKKHIYTYIIQFDILAIKEAILREIKREGQVFYVCPRIEDLKDIENILIKLDLNISSITMHGQMPPKDIEQNMQDFGNKKYDVLISTNIIESGIDLSNVNTIILHNSQKFGLSQLYQLRGRVGRGNKQAFAYLTYQNKNNLTDNAKKRLEILQSLDYLGASFALANYDLDLRGAGTLLGEKQSGQVTEIGIDLYQKLLEQEVSSLKLSQLKDAKNPQTNTKNQDYFHFSPLININLPIYIPNTYIEDIDLRMNFYRRIGDIKNQEEIKILSYELEDRFGKIPLPLTNLLNTIELKILSFHANIEKIVAGTKGITFHFYNNNFSNPPKLLEFISKNAPFFNLKPDSLVYKNNLETTEEQLTKTKFILTHLITLNKIE